MKKKLKGFTCIYRYVVSHIKVVSSYPQMPSIYETIPAETLEAMELAITESEDKHICRWEQEFITMFHQFRLYQNSRLKINKESRESKMAARKEGGGGKKGSAKMTGVVKLVAIEGQENTYKVEKVSIPVPVPVPAPAPVEPEPEEEEDISNNPEALAAAMAEAAERAATPVASPAPKPKSKGKRNLKITKKNEEVAAAAAVEECD